MAQASVVVKLWPFRESQGWICVWLILSHNIPSINLLVEFNQKRLGVFTSPTHLPQLRVLVSAALSSILHLPSLRMTSPIFSIHSNSTLNTRINTWPTCSLQTLLVFWTPFVFLFSPCTALRRFASLSFVLNDKIVVHCLIILCAVSHIPVCSLKGNNGFILLSIAYKPRNMGA